MAQKHSLLISNFNTFMKLYWQYCTTVNWRPNSDSSIPTFHYHRTRWMLQWVKQIGTSVVITIYYMHFLSTPSPISTISWQHYFHSEFMTPRPPLPPQKNKFQKKLGFLRNNEPSQLTTKKKNRCMKEKWNLISNRN